MGFGRPRRIDLRWLLLLGAAGGAVFPVAASAQQLAAAPPAQSLAAPRPRDVAQGRPRPHQVHHRAGALGRVPGVLAHQSQPGFRRAARRHAAAAVPAGRCSRRPRQVVPRRPVGARQGAHRHRRDWARRRRQGGDREGQGRQDRPARAGDRAGGAWRETKADSRCQAADGAGRRLRAWAPSTCSPPCRGRPCRRRRARSPPSSPSSFSIPDTAATTPGRRRTAPSRRTWCWRSASCCATSSTPPAATRC